MRIKLLEYINYDKRKFISRWESEGKPYIDKIGENGDGFIDWLETMDPSPRNKYVNWMIIRYLRGDIKRLEDIPSRISDALKKYISLGNKKKLKPEHRDINRIRDIEDVIDEYREVDVTSKSEKKDKFISSGEAEMVFDDAEYSIIIPKTEEASCYFGTNTRWCTASKNDNIFDTYNSEGPLYIILHKPSNTRWQFHFETGQYMDERDDEIDVISFFKKHRKLFEVFKKLGKVDYDNGVFKIGSNTGKIEYRNENGKLHREDGPAVIFPNETVYWFLNGEVHREDGPAIIRPDGTEFWCKNDEIHREDGPAVIYPDGRKRWYLSGKLLSKDEWEEMVSQKSSTNENINRLKQLSGLSKD